MRLSLKRTAESKGLIYQVFDVADQIVLQIERTVHDFNVWVLHFRSVRGAVQAVMRQDTIETEFQDVGGKKYGRTEEARFSVAGKTFLEDEAGNRLGSVSSGLGKVYFKDANDRKIGLARQTPGKGKFGFLPPSQVHRFWNHELEFEDTAYDERFVYVLICLLVTSEFGSTSS